MLDNLRFCSFDLLIAIALYLDPFDARKLAATSSSLRDVFMSEYLWAQYLQSRIKGFRGLGINNINALQTMIGVNSQLEMFCRFRYLNTPLLGYYRLADNFGAMYRIKVADNAVVCRLVNRYDEEDDEMVGFELTLQNAQMRRLSLTPATMVIDPDSLLFTFEGRPTLRLFPLPPLCSYYPQIRQPEEIVSHLGALLNYTVFLSCAICLAWSLHRTVHMAMKSFIYLSKVPVGDKKKMFMESLTSCVYAGACAR